ncbi:aspartate/glutamate racemase family protein [Brucella thiophenivorans]|nr:aspartate/glutamate racemase family protein [Brucella thiophenivorans]
MQFEQKSLGVIMLDTGFPRPPGDVGNPASWEMPVRFQKVCGASPDKIIRQGGADLIEDFVRAGEALIAVGCSALVTSCGFMARHQGTLSAKLSVPIGTSSLLQLPMVSRLIGPQRKVGVITYDEVSLDDAILMACGADIQTPRIGMPNGGAFRELIEGNGDYDRIALEVEIIQAAQELKLREPDLGAVVLECTNMPPFAQAVSRTCGFPVFDVLSLGHWLFSSTSARAFAGMSERVN